MRRRVRPATGRSPRLPMAPVATGVGATAPGSGARAPGWRYRCRGHRGDARLDASGEGSCARFRCQPGLRTHFGGPDGRSVHDRDSQAVTRPAHAGVDLPSIRSSVRYPTGDGMRTYAPASTRAVLDQLLEEPSLARGVVHHEVPGARRRCTRTGRSGWTRGSAAGSRSAGSSARTPTRRRRSRRCTPGEDIVVVTPTASGKSLCYTVPVLQALAEDPSARALFLFPTKALGQDQVAEFGELRAGCRPRRSRRPATTATRRRRSGRRSARPARSSSRTRTCSTRRSSPTTPSGSSCSSSSGSSSSTSCTRTAACSALTSPTCCGGSCACAPTTARNPVIVCCSATIGNPARARRAR